MNTESKELVCGSKVGQCLNHIIIQHTLPSSGPLQNRQKHHRVRCQRSQCFNHIVIQHTLPSSGPLQNRQKHHRVRGQQSEVTMFQPHHHTAYASIQWASTKQTKTSQGRGSAVTREYLPKECHVVTLYWTLLYLQFINCSFTCIHEQFVS